MKTHCLSRRERDAVWRVLDACLDKMSFDVELERFVDNGDILLTLDASEFALAQSAAEKLLRGIATD